MTDNEKTSASAFTDNEIIKALECCTKGEDCLNCPLKEQFANCTPLFLALNLINRKDAKIAELTEENDILKEEIEALKAGQITLQDLFVDKEAGYKAKIEKLQKENEILSANADKAFQEGLDESRELFKQEVEAQVKAEAVKECIEKVKSVATKKIPVWHGIPIGKPYEYILTSDELDNLLKEMAGEG